MKTIKITLATCVVALMSTLIWTACQKEEVNSTIKENTIDTKRGVPDHANKYTLLSKSVSSNLDIKADVLDNGKGTIVMNIQELQSSKIDKPSLFTVDLPMASNNTTETITIPKQGKWWLVNISEDEISVERVANGSTGTFFCVCNNNGSTDKMFCEVVKTSPKEGIIEYDCNVIGDCSLGCRGKYVTSTTPNSAPIEFDGDEGPGKVIIKADKLIVNGKVFQ